MAKTNIKNKKFILGITAFSALCAGSIFATVGAAMNVTQTNASAALEAQRNATKAAPDPTVTLPELSVNDYNPVLANQNVLPTITSQGYIGIGTSNQILDNTDNIVTDPKNGQPLTDIARCITFTTFDGFLRWKFDLNELNKVEAIKDAYPSGLDSLRIVDVKPLQENQGFIVLATSCGDTRKPTSYSDNAIFQITTDGKLIPESFFSMNLPSLGSGNVKDLLNNSAASTSPTARGAKTLSPYSLKITRSGSKALIQVSANPLMIKQSKPDNRMTVQDYFSYTATGADTFFEDGSEQTCPIVLLKYNYGLKQFDTIESTVSKTPRLINYTPRSAFEAYENNGKDQTMASEWIMYENSGNNLGCYSTTFTPDTVNATKTLEIYTNVLNGKKFQRANPIGVPQVFTPDDDIYFAPQAGYNGYTYSFTPTKYKDTSLSAAAELIIPGRSSFQLYSILAQSLKGTETFEGFIPESNPSYDSKTPKGSFIDPMYGSVIMSEKIDTLNAAGEITKTDYKMKYLNVAQPSNDAQGEWMLPTFFERSEFTVSNKSDFITAMNNTYGSSFPISSAFSVYDKASPFYQQFRMISFDRAGTFKVMEFNKESSNSLSINYNDVSYPIQTFINVQNQAKTIGWTPNKVKLSTIPQSRFETIGNYITVNATLGPRPAPEDLPLFYSSLTTPAKPYFPLDTLKLEHFHKDFENSIVTFDANFSYTMYGTTQPSIYVQPTKIYGFKKDPTVVTSNEFTMPRFQGQSNTPLVVNSPLAYQGYYSDKVNYTTGQQIAIADILLKSDGKPYVYQAKKDKPASVSFIDPATSTFDPSKFKEYFQPVMTLDGKTQQTPYAYTTVANYKGEFNASIPYHKNDVVRNPQTNALMIFTQDGSTLNSTVPYPGTDLSVLLPSSLTPNHVAMIIKDKLISGTVPPDFTSANVLISDFSASNLADANNMATVTAKFQLNKYFDDSGVIVDSAAGWEKQNVTINFTNPTKQTSLIDTYNVLEFGDTLANKYAYEVDLNNNVAFKQQIIDLNRKAGLLTDDITVNNVSVASPQPDDGAGILRVQIGLNRWYDDQGILNSSSINYLPVTITGFKKATVTQFSSNNITLRPDQIGVPGLNGKLPENVTAGEFIKDTRSIKDFLLNYTLTDGSNKLLIPASGRPGDFGPESIFISNEQVDSGKGTVSFTVKFSSYFKRNNLGIISHSTSNGISTTDSFNITISGFKKFIDNSIDTFKYDVSFSIDTKIQFPPDLQFTEQNPAPIPGIFVQNEKGRDPSLAENLRIAASDYLGRETISDLKNPQFISGFGLNDIGEVTDIIYNNFTGKIIFKAHLKRFIEMTNGVPTEVNYGEGWQTNPKAEKTFALTGFPAVQESSFNGQPLPFDKDAVVPDPVPSNPNKTKLNAATDTANSVKPVTIDFNLDLIDLPAGIDINNIQYSDIKNQIKWGGTWATIQATNNTTAAKQVLTLNTMDGILSSPNALKNDPTVTRNLADNTAELTFTFNKDIYYFAQKDLTTDTSVNEKDPYTLGNLGEPILLKAGSSIVIHLNNVKKFNLWEIVFWVGVGAAAFLILTLSIFLISKASHRRDLY